MERLRHVSVPFRRRCRARMFDVTERVRTGLYLFDSDNVNSLTSPPLHFECLLATSAACLSSEVDEKLTELVRKCEELYDMSNKECSDRVCKEKTEYYRLPCSLGSTKVPILSQMKPVHNLPIHFLTIVLIVSSYIRQCLQSGALP